MKKILFLLAFTTILACQKEDTKPVKNNEFSIGSKTFKVDEAWIENWGEETIGIHNNDILLVSKGVTPIFEDGLIEFFSGKGNLIYLELFSKTPNSYEVGTYNLSDTKQPFTFLSGYTFTDADFDQIKGDYSEFTGGKVKILSVKPNNIELEYELTNDNNQKVIGYFNGPTTIYDYSENSQARIKNSLVKKTKKPRFKL